MNMKKYCNIYLTFLFTLLGAVGFAISVQAQSETKKDTSVVELEPGPLLRIPKTRSILSYSTVQGNVLGRIPVPNLSNTLYGQLGGLMVSQGSGEPGNDQASLSFRGKGTYDNSNLVFFVDGFQVDYTVYFQYMSAGEIENISLLKDPVTLATFGMKGANGVLWVTTKRGSLQRPTINVQLTSGIGQPVHLNKPYGSYDYARLYNQAVSNDKYALNGYQYSWQPAYSDTQMQAYKNGTGTNVDWYNEALKNRGWYSNANVSVRGGAEAAKYGVFIDYMNQTGLYNATKNNNLGSNTQLQKFNIRSNVDLKFFKIFEAKIDLGGRIENRTYPRNVSDNDYSSAAYWATLASYPNNIYPVKDVTGNWSGTTLYPNNPVAQINATGIRTFHDRTLQANFQLKEDLSLITPGFYLSQSVSFNTWSRIRQLKTAAYARYFQGAQSTSDKQTVIQFGASDPWGQQTWKQLNLSSGYDRTFGAHDISAAVNYYVSDLLPDANGDVTRLYYHFENLSGRFNYTYKSRYTADLGFGYSGSDNYAPGNRWSFYPALALGWLVSNEPFFKENKIIDLLKLRVSAGQSGNDQTYSSRYLFQQYFNNTGALNTGNNGLNVNGGINLGRLAAANITAEKSTKYNVGVDLSLLHKISLSAEWFLDKRSGIIGQNNFVPGYYGYTGLGVLPLQNIGKMTNKGVEISLNYSDKIGELNYGIGGTLTYAKNRIDFMSEIPNKNSFTNSTGLAWGTPIGLTAIGFYDVTDFNPDGTLKAGLAKPSFGAVQPGDIKYKDLDNNNVIDNNDRTAIGNPAYPNLYYSFNLQLSYKGFDLSALFQGASGLSINLLNAGIIQQIVPFVGNASVYPIANNAWAYYPDQGIDTRATATFPRLSTLNNANNYTSSSFWIKSANFLRLRNIQLGYNLPAVMAKKMGMSRLRVFISAVNPVLWSAFYKQYRMDPETPSGYPAIKSYDTGISLTF